MDAYKTPPKDKDELMAWIEREWNRLMDAIRGLDEARLSAPAAGGWSIKDNLAHLEEWERFLRLNHLQRLPPHEVMGIEREDFDALDEDGINAILFERNKDRTAAEILERLQQSHAQVLADLAELSFTDLLKSRFEDGDTSLPVGLYVAGNTYLHYREHREIIERHLNEKGD